MMKQYTAAKERCGDALLLFRMGDFYELFYEDARVAAECLGLTLTSRDKGENAIAMAGFPHHQLDSYLAKLIQQGFRVAVCEQVEDPKLAKGLVKREVTRVVTPGTLTDDALLNPKEPNFLAAVVWEPSGRQAHDVQLGLAWVELSTGRFLATTISQDRLLDELARIRPAECLISEEDQVLAQQLTPHYRVTQQPDWCFGRESVRQRLQDQFHSPSMEGFGFHAEDTAALRAAGAILAYLRETQQATLSHLDRLIPFRESSSLLIDHATRQSLELTRTIREGGREGSLVSVLDRTVTAMGARLINEWLSAPLTDVTSIEQRLESVAEFTADHGRADKIRQVLREVFDLQRLLTRVTTQRASPRDLRRIAATLAILPRAKALLADYRAQRLQALEQAIDLCEELHARLRAALNDECPLSAREGGIIRDGYHPPLDELRELSRGGKQWIARYQAEQQQRLGIPSLKVGFNKVFGFYMEVTHTHRDKIPNDFIRKQTLKNAERFITPELKEYEDRVLHAEAQSQELEYELFCQLRDQVQVGSGSIAKHGRRPGRTGCADGPGRSGRPPRILPPPSGCRGHYRDRRRAASRPGSDGTRGHGGP